LRAQGFLCVDSSSQGLNPKFYWLLLRHD